MVRFSQAFAMALTLGALAPTALAGAGGTDNPGPWVGPNGPLVDRHILIRTEPGLVLNEGDSESGWSETGNGEIDRLNAHYSVEAVYRLHSDPPNGRRDPALFRALGLDRIYYVQFPAPRSDLAQLAAEYEERSSIELAWLDQVASHCSKPNDPLYASQWNYTLEDLDCEPGWNITTDSQVLVSVIDSGIDLKHADIDANLWKNPGEIAGNGVDDDGNGYVDDVHGWDFWNADRDPTDDYGHGTHVAGIIGAEGDNGRDIAGVCWNATIQAVKVLDTLGAGTWTSISQGMIYAADNGALVSNYSLGGASYDVGVDTATQYAAGLDIVQVAAAGNLATNAPFYPAWYADVIGVMASDYGEKRARWSSYGSWCDLCAPGDGITSLWKGGQTAVLTGTSQSAPHVAAIAALIRSVNPQLDRLDTELVIEYSAKDLGTAGRDSTYEWGLADLHRALDMAGSLSLSATNASVGSSIDLYVNRPDSALDLYVLLPSISGRTPGYYLGTQFPGDERYVPMNYDAVTDLSLLLLPNVGVWDNFIGYLDVSGLGTATINIPSGKILRNHANVFSGIILPASDLSTVKWVLNSVVLDVQ